MFSVKQVFGPAEGGSPNATFDTVDHQLLLHRLESSVSLVYVMLSWLGSRHI